MDPKARGLDGLSNERGLADLPRPGHDLDLATRFAQPLA
jgi:hypothetical protein